VEPTTPSSIPPSIPPSIPVASTSSSTTPPNGGVKRPPPLPQLVTELRDLVVRYVREQTLIPLQKLGRYIGFGVLGSLLLGFGVLFLGMSGLRALQEETGDTFSGDWSWVPYLIMFIALILGAALVWLARTARRAEKEYG
jgi:hypothetical protein